MSSNKRKVQQDRDNTTEKRVKRITDPIQKGGQRRVRRPPGNKGKSKS